jgi:hypothetical protein
MSKSSVAKLVLSNRRGVLVMDSPRKSPEDPEGRLRVYPHSSRANAVPHINFISTCSLALQVAFLHMYDSELMPAREYFDIL